MGSSFFKLLLFPKTPGIKQKKRFLARGWSDDYVIRDHIL